MQQPRPRHCGLSPSPLAPGHGSLTRGAGCQGGVRVAATRGTGPAEHVAAGWAARIPSGLAGLTAEATEVVVWGKGRVTGQRGPGGILGPQVGARWLLCLLDWELKLLTGSSDFLIKAAFSFQKVTKFFRHIEFFNTYMKY